MGKELTEKEAIHQLSVEIGERSFELHKKYNDFSHGGRDGGSTQEQHKLSIENGRRLSKIKEMYMNHKTLPESEVMKIVKGEF